MVGPQKRRKNIKKLTDWKQAQAEHTRERLDSALGRFELGKLINVAKGQKLTRLALAKEAGVAADTPFSRYRIGHAKEGEYRFPEIVRRFDSLRGKLSSKDQNRSLRQNVKELKQTNKHLSARLEANRRVVNAQDIRIKELEVRNSELEELLLKCGNERENLEDELKRLRRARLRDPSK